MADEEHDSNSHSGEEEDDVESQAIAAAMGFSSFGDRHPKGRVNQQHKLSDSPLNGGSEAQGAPTNDQKVEEHVDASSTKNSAASNMDTTPAQSKPKKKKDAAPSGLAAFLHRGQNLKYPTSPQQAPGSEQQAHPHTTEMEPDGKIHGDSSKRAPHSRIQAKPSWIHQPHPNDVEGRPEDWRTGERVKFPKHWLMGHWPEDHEPPKGWVEIFEDEGHVKAADEPIEPARSGEPTDEKNGGGMILRPQPNPRLEDWDWEGWSDGNGAKRTYDDLTAQEKQELRRGVVLPSGKKLQIRPGPLEDPWENLMKRSPSRPQKVQRSEVVIRGS